VICSDYDMSLPAALTWLQLLPNGTRFSCAGAPAWFERMLRAHGDGQMTSSNAAVVWARPWSDVAAEAAKGDPIVAIKCPQATTSRLIAAGYTYARRFAVLPSLEKARWFICLDTGKAAAASFSLYTPSRKSAHVKKAVAKMLAKLRVPGWYRDEIIVASRQPPPLETKLAELFPGQTIRLALSSGAPEPAINRKPSAAVIDAQGNLLAFVKIAVSDVSRRIVENEGNMLTALQQRGHLRSIGPRLLFAGEVDSRYITVQSPLPGKPAPLGMTVEHFAFVYALRGADKIASETNLVATLRARLDGLVPPRPDLLDAFDSVLPTLEQMTVNSTVVHGDFAPWNLRLHDGKISAFDWEYGDVDGLPRVDEIHFRLQQGMEIEKWDLDAAAAFLREHADREGGEEMRAVQAIYLLDHLARLLGEGYSREHDIVSLYEKLLAGLKLPKREAVLV
jgi:hypothetical protein